MSSICKYSLRTLFCKFSRSITIPIVHQPHSSDRAVILLLQGYVKRACLNVAASPIIARRLNCTSDAIVAAFKEACEASSEQSLVLEPPAVELGLAFRHQCLYAPDTCMFVARMET